MTNLAGWRQMLTRALLTSCALWLTGGLVPQIAWTQPVAGVECRDWRACRDEALAAEAASDGERFHDLAWRTAQLGPKDDPELMYLLARAQATSGRPSDAVVMLQRLARMGVATDADTLEVFRRVRARQAWAEVESLTATATRRVTVSDGVATREATADATSGASSSPPAPPAVAEAAASTAKAPAPAAVAPAGRPSSMRTASRPVTPTPLQGEVALRLEGLHVASGGFAYDAVSGRFLLGSTDERKIVVVDEPSRRAADLVRGDSAGFRQMVAMRIDTRRGDLWVVSNDAGPDGRTGGASLHKLQLIAGRPLGRLEPPASDGPVRFTDLTVTPDGAVLLVDAAGRRVYRAPARATTLTAVTTLDVPEPVALTSADSDDVVYVAHARGVSRVNLAGRATQPVTVPTDLALEGITGLWWHDRALVVLGTNDSGSRMLQRWQLDSAGTAVQSVQALDVPLPDASAPVAITLSGRDLFILTRPDTVEGTNGTDAGGDRTGLQTIVRRVRLRP